MLSRVAAQLYWLSRYLERAENMARILEVGQSFALLSSSDTSRAASDLVKEPLVITDTLSAFEATGRPLRADQVAQFLAWDPDHPSSIFNCIQSCRERARRAGRIDGRNVGMHQRHLAGIVGAQEEKQRTRSSRGLRFF